MCLWVVFSSETSVERYTYTTLKAVQKAEFIHWVAYNDMLNHGKICIQYGNVQDTLSVSTCIHIICSNTYSKVIYRLK